MPAANGSPAPGRSFSFWSIPSPSQGQLRSFGLLMAAVSVCAGGGLWYLGSLPEAVWAGGLAVWLLACALLWQGPLRPLYFAWMSIARVLGFVNSHLLLALVFYSIFTVVGLVMRLVRYDPLHKAGFKREEKSDGIDRGEGQKSYWSRREGSTPSRDHFQRQF